MNLKHLTDKSLLTDTKKLAQQERIITTKLLHHLKEVERRRLYSDLGHASLFVYAVKELGMSESAASRRIDAARMLADLPQIEKKLENGALNLSHISAASLTFKHEDIQDKEIKLEILGQIENKSKKECENILRDICSKPKLLTIVKAHLTDEELKLYEELKGLLAHRPKEKFWASLFQAAIEKIQAEKFKINSSRSSSTKNERYITAEVKKGVYLRDKVCQKCGSKYALEYDHVVPYSMGGKTSKENLRILCKSCNQRQRIKQKLLY